MCRIVDTIFETPVGIVPEQFPVKTAMDELKFEIQILHHCGIGFINRIVQQIPGGFFVVDPDIS